MNVPHTKPDYRGYLSLLVSQMRPVASLQFFPAINKDPFEPSVYGEAVRSYFYHMHFHD